MGIAKSDNTAEFAKLVNKTINKITYVTPEGNYAVSYTHLDVYKRQTTSSTTYFKYRSIFPAFEKHFNGFFFLFLRIIDEIK